MRRKICAAYIQYGAQIFQSRLVIMIAPDGRQKFAKLAARFCLRVCHTRGAKTLASLPNCYVAVSKRNIDSQATVCSNRPEAG